MTAMRALLATALMSATLIALAIGLRGPYLDLLAHDLRQQFETAPLDRLDAAMNEAVRLGRPGFAALSDALGSQRPEVAQAARATLADALFAWRHDDPPAAAQRCADLAACLADRAADFDADAQQRAAGLAEQILVALSDVHAADRGPIVADCVIVLRLAQGRPGTAVQNTESLADARERLLGGSLTLPRPDELARLPGGGLPIAGVTAPRYGQSAAGAEPGVLEAAPSLLSRDTTSAAADMRGLASAAAGPQRSQVHPADEVAATDAAGALKPMSLTTTQASAGPQPDMLSDRPQSEIVALMRDFTGPDTAKAATARDELARRGFSDVHFDLARRLFDPRPEVRRALVRALPSLGSIDPAAWLLWLCRDPDADVRVTAATLLATAADPAILAEVEHLARNDSDPRMQRCAELIARRQR